MSKSRIYLIFSYMFFIFPPFIAGLAAIYYDNFDSIHIISLVINILVLIIITTVFYFRVKYGNLHIPESLERKYIIFGLIGNITMYLYTFQNNLNINNIVTIYLVLLIVLAVHTFLISKKLQPQELWILLPLFIVFDYLYLALRGCGWGEWSCTVNESSDTILVLIYWALFIFIVIYYILKIIQLKQFDVFKIINIVLMTILSIYALNEFNGGEDFLLTISIITPFVAIVDFIVKFVNKQFDKRMPLFYIRTGAILIFCMMVGLMDVAFNDFDNEALMLFVTVTYISLGLNILRGLLKIENSPINVKTLFTKDLSTPYIVPMYESDVESLKEFSTSIDSFTFDEQSFNFKLYLNTNLKGIIHTGYVKESFAPHVTLCRIYILETDEFDYTNTVLDHLESYFLSKKVDGITYLAHVEEEEMIELLVKRKYIPIEVKKDEYYLFMKTKK